MAETISFCHEIPTEEKEVKLVVNNIVLLFEALMTFDANEKVKEWALDNQFEVKNSLGQVNKWKLTLATVKDKPEVCSLYLYRITERNPLEFKESIVVTQVNLDTNLSTSKFRTWSHRFKPHDDDEGYGWGSFLNMKTVVEEYKTKNENDSLNVKMTFRFMFTPSRTSFSHSQSNAAKQKIMEITSKEKTLDMLGSILQNVNNSRLSSHSSSISEVVLHMTKDNKKLKAHVAILSARSRVFAQMFETEMKEKKTGIVKIKEIGSEAMKMVLEYFYTGKFPTVTEGGNSGNWSNLAQDVVNAAEKYELDLLKQFCDQNLVAACTNENALDMLKLAQLYKLTIAEKEIFSYIRGNLDRMLLEPTDNSRMVIENNNNDDEETMSEN